MENSIEWYKTLSVNQKINLKECFILLCGMEWHEISFLFSIGEKITMAHQKMKLEGFDV